MGDRGVTGSGALGPALTYQWHKNGVPLTDGPTPNGSSINGSTSDTLTLIGVRSDDVGQYHARVSNTCGSVASNTATLEVCIADFNCSGGTPDDADVDAFFLAWNNGEASADLNASGGTPDDADVDHFFTRWNMGC